MKGAGHIMRMYGHSTGVTDFVKYAESYKFPSTVKFNYNFRHTEARILAYYGYDPRNYFGKHALRVQR